MLNSPVEQALVCEHCGGPFEPRTFRGGRPKRFCSPQCRTNAWWAKDPERSAQTRHETYVAHREKRIAEATAYKKRNPPPQDEKHQARRELLAAVREGRVVRGPCEVNVDCRGRIEGHHENYSKPLEVRWLCAKHHGEQHRRG